jgi:hypothetical protein
MCKSGVASRQARRPDGKARRPRVSGNIWGRSNAASGDASAVECSQNLHHGLRAAALAFLAWRRSRYLVFTSSTFGVQSPGENAHGGLESGFDDRCRLLRRDHARAERGGRLMVRAGVRFASLGANVVRSGGRRPGYDCLGMDRARHLPGQVGQHEITTLWVRLRNDYPQVVTIAATAVVAPTRFRG